MAKGAVQAKKKKARAASKERFRNRGQPVAKGSNLTKKKKLRP